MSIKSEAYDHVARHDLEGCLKWLACPACSNSMEIVEDYMLCSGCGRRFKVDRGIPLLFLSEAGGVTEVVKAFYEANPFPSYDALDTADMLVEKSRKGVFARLLDNQIPRDSLVLEAGCGTGQLSSFLGISGRTVFGTDISLSSLREGESFKIRNGLKNVHFVQMNIFKPVFPKDIFDLVICNDVLHHTYDPFAGFRSLSTLVRPGGHIVVGLYNAFGRMWTDLRRAIFRLTKNHFLFLDPYLRRPNVDALRKRIWFADQYENPHESKQHNG